MALPPAADDDRLDQVWEMIAVKFGFKAYVDQGCNHEGTVCAEILARVANEFRSDGGGSDDDSGGGDKKGATKKLDDPMTRDAKAVVITEIAVLPLDVHTPMELARALVQLGTWIDTQRR